LLFHETDDRLAALLEAGGMIRVEPVHYNTLDEIERFGEVLKNAAS
jgi:selenocysteine lyase/cysteine desulfurase